MKLVMSPGHLSRCQYEARYRDVRTADRPNPMPTGTQMAQPMRLGSPESKTARTEVCG